MRMVRASIMILVLSVGASCLAQARDGHVDSVKLDISAQPLGDALNAFAKQAGLQVVLYSRIGEGLTSPPISGSLSRDSALNRLLEKTGLRFEYIDADTVGIFAAGEKGNALGKPVAAAAAGDAMHVAQTDDAAGSHDAAAGSQADRSGSADMASAQGERLEEIVVTAQKRKERLREVPISISVLNGADLDRSTDRGITEALNRLPGVTAQTTVARTGSSAVIMAMRGIPPAAGVSPTAYYLDSIPFGFVKAQLAPDASGYDLERLEVLRGPQGTLYGLSALNGVVRVLTKDANLERFEAKTRVSGSATEHGGENYRMDAAVNVPIIEGKLAVRAVVGYQDLSGWIDRPNRENANDTQVGTYRLKINAQPTEQLSVGLFAWLSRTNQGSGSIAGIGNALDPLDAVNPLVNPSTIDEASTTSYDAYGFKVGYDFAGASLSSMTSYIDYRVHSRFDYTPFVYASLFNVSKATTQLVAQEINLNSRREGPWKWSLGAIYRDSKDLSLLSRRDTTGALVSSTYLAPNIQGSESKSFAVFGELTRAFLDGRLELTAGLRHFEDKARDTEISRRQCINGIPAGIGSCPLQADQTVVPAPLSVLNDTFDNFSPRFVLNWHRTDAQTFYASYAQGYRSGQNQAFSTNLLAPGFPPEQPDKLKSYEVGAKVGLWGNRVNLDTAVFFIDWKNVPQGLAVPVPGPTPFIVNALVNAQTASGLGAEASMSLQATDRLKLGANFSWSGLEVDKDVLTDGLVLYSKGSRLEFSPEYTIGATANYEFPLGGNGLAGRISLAANYLPETIVARNPAPAGTPAVENPFDFTILGATWSADSLLMAHLNIGIESPKGWSAALYVDNLASQKGLTRDPFSPRWNSYIRPRTIGLQFDYRYK